MKDFDMVVVVKVLLIWMIQVCSNILNQGIDQINLSLLILLEEINNIQKWTNEIIISPLFR